MVLHAKDSHAAFGRTEMPIVYMLWNQIPLSESTTYSSLLGQTGTPFVHFSLITLCLYNTVIWVDDTV